MTTTGRPNGDVHDSYYPLLYHIRAYGKTKSRASARSPPCHVTRQSYAFGGSPKQLIHN